MANKNTYVPATDNSTNAKKWVNHLNNQIRNGGKVGVVGGEPNKEIYIPATTEEPEHTVLSDRGYFSASFSMSNNLLYIYDSLYLENRTPDQIYSHICGYCKVGNYNVPVWDDSFTVLQNAAGNYYIEVAVYIYMEGEELKAKLIDVSTLSTGGTNEELSKKLSCVINLFRYLNGKVYYDYYPTFVVVAPRLPE